MAVFTKINQQEIEKFINNYDIGILEKYTEIIEGIENTNYKLICDGRPYILTIFEKRVKEKDLPFYMHLKLFLNNNNFKCPKPIRNKDEKIINKIKDKNAVIVSFIEGSKIEIPSDKECYEVGKMLGDLHLISKNFEMKKENDLSFLELKKIFKKSMNAKREEFEDIYNILNIEIDFLEKSLPKELPSGIIHADLFKDNIFFNKSKITGVIDFYFSCYHYFLYDISIVINDWCFENTGKKFNYNFFNSVIEGYNIFRKFEKKEIDAFNIILRIATIRILITRLHDYIFHPDDAVLVKKNPYEYLNILKWHQTNILLLER